MKEYNVEGGEGSNAMTSALRPRTINSEPSMVSFVYMTAHAIVPISITCFSYSTHFANMSACLLLVGISFLEVTCNPNQQNTTFDRAAFSSINCC